LPAARDKKVFANSSLSIGLAKKKPCPSTSFGPYPLTLVADWMAARLAGDPLKSERWFVTASGAVNKTPI
jgi:hypothetical protein